VFIAVQVKLLQRLSHSGRVGHEAYFTTSKVETFLGGEFLGSIGGKTIIDFGCGEGSAAIELAQRGARRVIGVDIREDVLRVARRKARESGVGHICSFTNSTQERADVIISLDAFEHFAEPAAILRVMDALLKPGGEVLACFGPTWYHPFGGHLFSVFPWAHLILSEEALCRWRSGFKTDGASRFREVAGGLNQLSIRAFEKIVQASPFQPVFLECVPIRKLRWLHNRVTREFTSSIVRCRLVQRAGASKPIDVDSLSLMAR
jgi:SAM-dependent methyltransferase